MIVENTIEQDLLFKYEEALRRCQRHLKEMEGDLELCRAIMQHYRRGSWETADKE